MGTCLLRTMRSQRRRVRRHMMKIGGQTANVSPVELIDQECPAIVKENWASMRTGGRGRGARQSRNQRVLFTYPKFAPATQSRTACQANQQAILPIAAILCRYTRKFGQMAYKLFLANAVGHRAYEETAPTETLTFQA